MKVSVSIVLLSFFYGISSVPINASRICASKKKNIENISLKQNTHDIEDVSREINLLRMQTNQPEVTFETCNNFCYALWQEEKHLNGTKIIILLQGCWKQSGERKCDNTECIALKGSTKALNNTKFCCCNGDYCNQNITDTLDLSYAENEASQILPETTGFLERAESERWMLIVGSVVVGTLILVCAITMLVYRAYRNNVLGKMEKPMSYGDGSMESTSLRTGTYTVDHLKLASIVGQGRYGSVWQGSMGDRDVAVKIFPSHYRNYFQNERDTYRLPFMEHPSLLSYYGVDERLNMEGNVDYLLVLSYAPRGTLTDFLRAQTVDWPSFCKMGLSIVKGLAYLHTDIRKGDKLKPCIAHRDMNSRNILIKNDGSCCICDLGLAVQISGSKYFSNGEEQHAETKSINDVGTLRYMAPEVLEGAVNLRDCESSLKQIDVYAMGLILWEIVSRCSDIYVPGSEVPTYKQPFEHEIGLHPSFEEMQVLVSRNKARPMLEGNLVDRPGVRLIKETMEDCWDSDAEARLTALCIEERLTELQSHRVTAYFMDGSPIVNSCSALVPPTTSSQYSDVCYHDNIHAPSTDFNVPQDRTTRNESSADNHTASSLPFESIQLEQNCKNSNETATSRHSQTLQPHQGRNPCMERNLMLPSDSRDDLGSNSKILVDRSSKHVSSNDQYKLHAELQSLVSNEYPVRNAGQLSQPRPATPIPYVQNVITENGVLQCNKRKQTNTSETRCSQENPRRKRFAGWSNIKRLLVNKKMYPYTKCQIEREDSKSNLLTKHRLPVKTVETNVTISPGGKYINGVISKSSTSDSLSGKMENDTRTRVAIPDYVDDVESSERPSSLSLVNLSIEKTDNDLARRESLDKFNEVFNVGGNSMALKHPNMRIKTPGDLPPSVRKVRGRAQSAARFSLYDDRMMCNIYNEEGNRNEKIISNSVPFGMDCSDSVDQSTSSLTMGTKNVTCF